MFLWPGKTANWHFLPVPKEISLRINEQVPNRRGFGSVPVEVTIGETTWQTSIFPDSQSSTFILPVKAKVRKVEDIEAGESVTFTLVLR